MQRTKTALPEKLHEIFYRAIGPETLTYVYEKWVAYSLNIPPREFASDIACLDNWHWRIEGDDCIYGSLQPSKYKGLVRAHYDGIFIWISGADR